jgi:hypothetical protein
MRDPPDKAKPFIHNFDLTKIVDLISQFHTASFVVPSDIVSWNDKMIRQSDIIMYFAECVPHQRFALKIMRSLVVIQVQIAAHP